MNCWIATFALLLVSCTQSTDDPSPPDASSIDEGVELLGANWTLAPGSETYRCARWTLSEDTYISKFIVNASEGTHHTVLTRSATQMGPDGDYPCDAAALGHNMLFSSGVGTNDMEFPAGVAVKIPAGTQLNLNIHLFNTSDTELKGRSAIEVVLAEASEVQHEAEMIFAGTQNISLSSGNTEQTVSGGCNAPEDTTIVALWPHMHQWGTRMGIELSRDGQSIASFDQPFSFYEQKSYIETWDVKAGDRIQVSCSYINQSGRRVFFGDSSESEMCFAGFYRYPATGANLFSCVDQ